MTLLSTRRVMTSLLVAVSIAVYIFSSNTDILLSQPKSVITNTRKLQASNIHRHGGIQHAQSRPNNTGLVEFNSSATSEDQSDGGSVLVTDNTDGDGVAFKRTKVEYNNITTSIIQYIPNQSRSYSPTPSRITKDIKRLPTDLKTEYNSKIKEYNEYHNTPFLSLSRANMWYAFTEIMRTMGYQQRLPRVINIGVKKSGTTALGFFVGAHPQIAHSFGNEVHFFDKPERTKLGMRYYRSKMAFSNKHQVPFEKTPKYFITKRAPKAILKDLPKNIKFLLCVRDPVKRAISEYHHDMEYMLRHNKSSELREAKRRSPEEQGKLFTEKFFDADGQVHGNKTVIKTSIYSYHLKNWLKTFPRDRFLVVDLGNLKENTYVELKRIETFLELDPFFEPSMMYKSRKHGTCLKIKGHISCPGRSTPGFTQKAKLDSRVQRTMYDFYRPYNQEFAKLIGERFDWMDL